MNKQKSEIEHFTIDQVGWHTQVEGDREPTEKIHRRFRSVMQFLQTHQLTHRTILADGESITDDTVIHSQDLTPLGFELMKTCYSQWLRGVDKGKSPEDMRLFERLLLELQSKKSI